MSSHLKQLQCYSCDSIRHVDQSSLYVQCGECVLADRPRARWNFDWNCFGEYDPKTNRFTKPLYGTSRAGAPAEAAS